MASERRQLERIPYEKMIDFSVNVFEIKEFKKLTLKGNAINISEGGICLRTNYPLENGHILKFHNDTEHYAGIVKWSENSGNACPIGAKFI